MRLDESVTWYQKKIGTYDKEQWEKTLEQNILNGFSSITLKNASKNSKLKTEYIDVDLVRGSTFPKAKPKQSLLTVIRLAILRYFLLPCYAKFWSSQTSPTIFTLLLFIYVLQMINLAVYSFKVQKDTEVLVSIFEVIIPMLLSLILSLIHSQIVATYSINTINRNNRKNLVSKNIKSLDTTRRKKKYLRVRSQDGETSQNKISSKKSSLRLDDNSSINSKIQESSLIDEKISINENNMPLWNSASTENIKLSDTRKRNVNWDSPIHNYAIESMIDKINSEVETDAHNSNTDIKVVVEDFYSDLIVKLENTESEKKTHQLVDDGFESFNGKSSSGEENNFLTDRANVIDLNNDRHKKNSNDNLQTVSSLHLHRRRIAASKTDAEKNVNKVNVANKSNLNGSNKTKKSDDNTSDTDEEGDDGEIVSSPASTSNYNECTTSATEWLGITTNSDECSYSSGPDDSDFQQNFSDEKNNYDYTPSVILTPCGSTDKISCTIWDKGQDVKKAEMSVLDISSCIIKKVEAMPETCDYLYIGCAFSLILALIPTFWRFCEATVDGENSSDFNYLELPQIIWEKASLSLFKIAWGESYWEQIILTINFIQRVLLNFTLFFLFSVAERTFKQRFMYAKLFSRLTSSRRARKSELPHFRLNKVRNIKTWLSVRSYLKRRGPQRSIDVIVSAAFMITLLLLAFLSVEWLKDSSHAHSFLTVEALLWSSALGVFLLRFMTLGNKTNQKYRSISVLITEQINLYLQIEQKPKKKEEIMVANSVLKLAADLLKELETPFKISGLSANPYLFTTIKVVIMSALSGVLSEMFGFKLKLHKIKIK